MRLVRKLTAVEGLGSCAYIASDKTGTFMVNKQTVRQLTLPSGKQVSVSGEGYSGDGAILDAADNPIFAGEHAHLERLALVAIRCNEAGLTREQEEWHYHGDAVDVALPAFAYKLGLDPRWIRRDTIVVGEIRLSRNGATRPGCIAIMTTDWDDILTGRQLEELGEVVTPELLETIKSIRVFARVTPLQKLQIVEQTAYLANSVMKSNGA